MANDFGDFIHRVRIGQRQSLRHVAGRLGVTPTYLSDIERGRRNPPAPDKLEKLARALGIQRARLEDKALIARRAVELVLTGEATDRKDELALILARRWEGLTGEEIDSLKRELGRGGNTR